jgi:PAS domain S-box-containing protein
MQWNKLLEKQIKKYLSEQSVRQDDIQHFINAVNNSYNAYEKDQILSEHAFKISELEYAEINEKLKSEVELKQLGIKNLKAAIKKIDDRPENLLPPDSDEDNLIDTLGYLNLQIEKRKAIEYELKNSEYRLSATAKRLSQLIANLNNGVVVEDELGNIVLTNQLFCDMFSISESPEALIGSSSDIITRQSSVLLTEPEAFTTQVQLLIKQKKLKTGDELHLKDGRYIVRDYVPVYIDNEYKGHLWRYADKTKEKQNTNTLKRLSLVASANENGILFTGEKGTITWTNEGFKKLTGYSEEEMKQKNPIQLCSGKLSDGTTLLKITKAFLNKKSFNHEIILHRSNGTWFWSRIKGQSLPQEESESNQYFFMVEDITYEKEQEEQVRVLSLLAEENLNAVVIANADGALEWTNKSFTRITGYTLEEVKGKKPGQFLQGPGTDPETVAYLGKQIKAGLPFNCEILNYTKFNVPYWLRIQGQAIRNKQGEVIRYFALEEDITQQKEAEEKLRESQLRWQFALEGAGDGVWEYDFQTEEVNFSRQYKKMLGYTDEEFKNEKEEWFSRIHPDDIHIITTTDQQYANGSISNHQREYRIKNKKQEYIWILDRGIIMSKTAGNKPLRMIGTHTDITERKLAEDAIRLKEQKYRGIIANMSLGLLEVDLNEHIIFANQSFCEMCGYTSEELIGQKASGIFLKGDNIEIMDLKNEARKKGKTDAYEIIVKDKRGQMRWWFISGAPNYNNNGELIGSIGIHLDITNQKKLEQDLIEAREEAEESSKAKEMFLANMSHEIRTPINAILGMGNQLLKTSLNGNQRFFLNIVNASAENLLVIINDILDISKIEAGHLSLENIGFRIEDVLNRTASVMLHKAEEKGLRLMLSVDKTIAPILVGDPYRLNQVLLNLVSNAVKFTEKGSVKVECYLFKKNSTQQTVCISVKDTGIGIEQEYIDKLFQKFSQEDKSVARMYGGTGLGMSICKELITLMNGTISVESQKGKGTEISICIPFSIGGDNDIPVKEEKKKDSTILKGRKILLVEDNEMNRLLVNIILKHYGTVVTEAFNGVEAIKAMQHNQYDIVLMDMQMPLMDGLEATRIIRKELNNTIPIIALTANAIKGENEKCIEAGMNDFISKPFAEEDLIAIMAEWLTQTPEMAAQKKPTITNTAPLYNLSGLKEISRGNDAFVQKMIALFTEQAPAAAKEMQDAFNHQDYRTVQSVAHRIKPILDHLRIDSVKNEIREIETFNVEEKPITHLEHLISIITDIIQQVASDIGRGVSDED